MSGDTLQGSIFSLIMSSGKAAVFVIRDLMAGGLVPAGIRPLALARFQIRRPHFWVPSRGLAAFRLSPALVAIWCLHMRWELCSYY
jgi:hypothetical protein